MKGIFDGDEVWKLFDFSKHFLLKQLNEQVIC